MGAVVANPSVCEVAISFAKKSVMKLHCPNFHGIQKRCPRNRMVLYGFLFFEGTLFGIGFKGTQRAILFEDAPINRMQWVPQPQAL